MRALATWIGMATFAFAGVAAAQTYPSALPLRGADAGEYESRLANILELARPNQVTRFRLPSGRTVSVRSYLPTQISGSGPCRGYRVDLSGEGGFMAVDGFRCRDNNGNRWQLVEPETVLAQSGNAPLALTEGSTPTASRSPGEPLYADDDAPLVGQNGIPVDANGNPIGLEVVSRQTSPVPVPRPRPSVPTPSEPVNVADASPQAPAATQVSPPEEPQTDAGPPRTRAGTGPAGLTETAERTILLNEPQEGEPAYVTQLRERMERARRLEEEVASVVRGTTNAAAKTDRNAAVITPSLAPDEAASDPVTNAPASTVNRRITTIAPALSSDVDVALAERAASAERILGPVQSAPSRVVGARQTDEVLGYAADRRIISALQDLRYLSGRSAPSASAVDAAVNEFATDERFALPIGNNALLARLTEAAQRSSTLPVCARGNGVSSGNATLCISAN